MQFRNISTFILSLTLLCTTTGMKASGLKEANKRGRKLFNLELADMQKKDVELMDYVGKSDYTVVTFFAEYCAACITELDSVNKIYEGWQSKYHANFLAINVSNKKDVAKIIEKASSRKWKFDMLIDDRNEAMNMLRIKQIPHILIVDKEGYVVYEHSGYSPDNLRMMEKLLSEKN